MLERDDRGRIIITKPIAIIMVVVTILVICAIALLSAFLWVNSANNAVWLRHANNMYNGTYYDLVGDFLQMETNLSKMRVITSSGLGQELLLAVVLASQSAVNNLSRLSATNQDMSALIKYTNQAGDYCKFLMRKLGKDIPLTAEDYEMIGKLYDMTYQLSTSLASIGEQVKESGNLVQGIDKFNTAFSDILLEFNNGSIKYPSLIYDGAFSDSLTDREPTMVKGDKVDPTNARAYIVNALADYEVKDIEFVAYNHNKFTTFLYKFTTADGLVGSIQLAEVGGFVTMWDVPSQVKDPQFSKDEGIEIARQYCAKVGLRDMQVVWSSVSESNLYVNMCYSEQNVVFYPDMIKLKISLETGKVVGYEGLNYCYNHIENRQNLLPKVTKEQVQNFDYKDMKVDEIRLVVIPTEWKSEILAWEVTGRLGEWQFLIYLDAHDGKEIRILQVVDGDEGHLLM